jgi:hypothetical protein
LPVAMLFPTGILGFEPSVPTVLLYYITGTMAFVACGLVSVPAAWRWALAIEFFIIGTEGRGALLGFLAAATVVWLFNPWHVRPNVRTVGVLVGLGLMLAASAMLDLDFGNYGSRAISPRQFIQNLEGSFADTGSEALDGSRHWREEWWNTIIDYTVFGSYFWTGKGYGINLADDDGFQVLDETEPLRSPHNSHLTFLARSGVPGFLLWIALQLTWVVHLLRVLFFARRTGRRRTVGLITFFIGLLDGHYGCGRNRRRPGGSPGGDLVLDDLRRRRRRSRHDPPRRRFLRADGVRRGCRVGEALPSNCATAPATPLHLGFHPRRRHQRRHVTQRGDLTRSNQRRR